MATHELLKNTLDTLSSTNVMLSWCIFHEKNGTITVRIRYNSNKESTNHDNDTYFRRKSTRQVTRDRERTRRWREQQQQPRQTHINATDSYLLDPDNKYQQDPE